MHIPAEWALPYWLSNAVAIGILYASWRSAKIGKYLFAAMFVGASFANTRMAIANPADYLNYADFALLPGYRDFILGYFAAHITAIVLTIALCQFAIGVMLTGRGFYFGVGRFGAIVFLLSIAPLGVGAAFPFSLICVTALAVLDRQTTAASQGPRPVARAR